MQCWVISMPMVLALPLWNLHGGIGAVSWGVISEVRMEEMIRSFKVMRV